MPFEMPLRLKTYSLVLGIAGALGFSEGKAGPARQDSLIRIEPQGEITLPQVLALALTGNPSLQAKILEARATESRRMQATARPNPELQVETEDALGSGPYRGMDQSQTTVQVEQALEWGGKRKARRNLARAESEAFAHELGQKRQQVLTQTTQAFIRLLGAQAEYAMRQEEVALADQNAASLEPQVQVGRLAPFMALRAKAEAGSARIALEWARHELDEAREAMAAQWGSHPPRFQVAVGALDAGPPPPSFHALLPHLENNPAWQGAQARIAESRAHADLEKANAAINLSLRGGYRRIAGPGENAVVLGMSMPLPFFQRNQGRIEESRHLVSASEKQAQDTRLHLIEDMAEAHDLMLTAQVECKLLRDTVLPAAKAAYENVLPGFQSGRYGHNDLIETRRAFLLARSQDLKARMAYHQAKAELEGLLTQSLNSLSETNSP